MTDALLRPKAPWLRAAVLMLAGIETAVFGFIGFGFAYQAMTANEQLGRSIGWGIATGMAVLFGLFALPALILGVLGRWLWIGLILAIAGLAVPLALRFLT